MGIIYKLSAALLAVGMTAVPTWAVKTVTLTAAEQKTFLEEADDFIDDMPDGLQDRQADAVLHAMKGMGAELATVRKSREGAVPQGKGVETIDILPDGAARGIPMRLYKPSETKGVLPLLIYFHGGGWTFGGIGSCSGFCSSLASTGEAMVLAVDYSLAPEKPYPAGLEDCKASLDYALCKASEWGSDPSLVSLGGDSSGGNLALSVALSAPGKVRSLVLFYPVVKAFNDRSESWREYSRGYGLDGRLMEAFNRAYCGDSDCHEPMISPGLAGDDELRGLPPALIVSAGRDILSDQGRELASRLSDVDHVVFDGAVHLFITVPGQPAAFEKAVNLATSHLKRRE